MTLDRSTCFAEDRLVSAGTKRLKFTGNGRCELDSHADTGCAGPDCYVEFLWDETVNVYPFSAESSTMKNISIGTVIYAVDDPQTGETVLLVLVHEQLIFGDRMSTSLLNPNQLRSYGVKVNECPKQFDRSSPHSVSVPRKNVFLELPLELDGVISYLAVRKPTSEELRHCKRLQCTSDSPWDPSSHDWNQKENDASRVYTASTSSKQIGEKEEEGQLPAAPAISAELRLECEEQARRLCYLQSVLRRMRIPFLLH